MASDFFEASQQVASEKKRREQQRRVGMSGRKAHPVGFDRNCQLCFSRNSRIFRAVRVKAKPEVSSTVTHRGLEVTISP